MSGSLDVSDCAESVSEINWFAAIDENEELRKDRRERAE
jgi:hypothetical protein